MNNVSQEKEVHKEKILGNLNQENVSAFQKYRDFFVGSRDMLTFLRFELSQMFLALLPGAVGLLLRKKLYPVLFKKVGSGVVFGRNLALRHPGSIVLGDRVAIDDNCLLDAKGAGEEGFVIGNDVLIARDTIIQAKCAFIEIGDHCSIGSQCQLSSAGGIQFGKNVMIAGQCYIGGGRYHTEDRTIPMMEQGLYSKGPVVIEDDVWIGAGVVIQDGVHIGRGSVIGSGAVVREDIPEYTIVTPHHRLIMLPRES